MRTRRRSPAEYGRMSTSSPFLEPVVTNAVQVRHLRLAGVDAGARAPSVLPGTSLDASVVSLECAPGEGACCMDR